MKLESLRATRNNFIKLIDPLSLAQLHEIPKEFNNNIIWNFMHNIVAQQSLCYKLSGLPINVSDEIFEAFKKGSVPTTDMMTEKELAYFKEFALSSIEQLEKDYDHQKFKEYTLYETSFGVVLDKIETAIAFDPIHEGLHLGYAMALKRAIIS